MQPGDVRAGGAAGEHRVADPGDGPRDQGAGAVQSVEVLQGGGANADERPPAGLLNGEEVGGGGVRVDEGDGRVSASRGQRHLLERLGVHRQEPVPGQGGGARGPQGAGRGHPPVQGGVRLHAQLGGALPVGALRHPVEEAERAEPHVPDRGAGGDAGAGQPVSLTPQDDAALGAALLGGPPVRFTAQDQVPLGRGEPGRVPVGLASEEDGADGSSDLFLWCDRRADPLALGDRDLVDPRGRVAPALEAEEVERGHCAGLGVLVVRGPGAVRVGPPHPVRGRGAHPRDLDADGLAHQVRGKRGDVGGAQLIGPESGVDVDERVEAVHRERGASRDVGVEAHRP